MTVIAVQPDMVVWAREFRGLDRASAAERLAFTEEDLAAIEGGKKPVNLTFFKKLSDRFRIPRATLLRRTRPAVPPMPMDFRTVDGRDATLGFDVRLAISYAYTIEQNVLELVEAEAAPPTPVLPQIALSDNAAEAGERERRRLGVSGITQLAWGFDDAFRNWRTVIESAGVYVLLKKWDREDCLGFTIYRDRNAPIIVINKADEYEPIRTFTLLHEYAHLLLRQPGISDQNYANPVEAYCNRFAGAFLMPRAVLAEILPYWPATPVEWGADQIRTWARRLKVSQQALALRLEQLGVAPLGFYARLVEQQRVKNRQKSGGNYNNTQVNELGDRFTSTVLRAANAQIISNGEAAELLDMAPRYFDGMREQIENQFARIGVGRR